VVAQVVDVIYYHKFDPHDQPLDNLRYILFGKGSEKFLAHRIIGPFQRTNHAEFAQRISVNMHGFDFSDEQLWHGVVLTFAGRPNDATDRTRKQRTSASGARPLHIAPSDPDALTPSERRVAELATAGYSDRDIAQTLFITANTVEMHLAATYHKLGITGRNDLTGVSLSCP
jgi:DNA-binding NarL/FixJ family response regulator